MCRGCACDPRLRGLELACPILVKIGRQVVEIKGVPCGMLETSAFRVFNDAEIAPYEVQSLALGWASYSEIAVLSSRPLAAF